MASTPLTHGAPLTAEESAERLAAFATTEPTRYLGVLWITGEFGVARSVFAARAATDAALWSAFTLSCEQWRYVVRRTYEFGTDAQAADAWNNEGTV